MTDLNLTITIKLTSGNGYSGANWEYQIRDDDGNLWCDGGYETEAAARTSGRRHVRRLRRAA